MLTRDDELQPLVRLVVLPRELLVRLSKFNLQLADTLPRLIDGSEAAAQVSVLLGERRALLGVERRTARDQLEEVARRHVIDQQPAAAGAAAAALELTAGECTTPLGHSVRLDESAHQRQPRGLRRRVVAAVSKGGRARPGVRPRCACLGAVGVERHAESHRPGELIGHLLERGGRPVANHIDDAPIEERRRRRRSILPVDAARVHCEDHVQVALHVRDEGRPQLRLGARAVARRLRRLAALLHQRRHLIAFKERGHFSAREQSIHLLEEGGLHRVRLVEDERHSLLPDARTAEEAAEIVGESRRRVRAARLHFEDRETFEPRDEPSEGGLAGAARADEEHVTHRLLQHARDPQRMLGHIVKENERGAHLLVGEGLQLRDEEGAQPRRVARRVPASEPR